MAQNVIIAGVSYPDVPFIDVPKTGGGDASFIDISGTTAVASDVKNGKIFYLSNGSQATGSYIWDWMGEEAECINNDVHSYSTTLDFTGYNGWTPSTTAKVIVDSVNKSAVSINTGTYDYYIKWSFTADVTYLSGVTKKAIPIRQSIELWQVICKRPSSYANLQIPTYTGNGCVTMLTVPIIDYYNTSGTRTMTYTGSYGFYPSAVAATFSNATSDTPNLTIKTPTISARCSSSYFATTRGAYVDQKHSVLKMHGELWRVKKSFAVEKMYMSAVELYNNPLPVYNYRIRNTLTGCTTNNSNTSINPDEEYTAIITADAGYTLEGATVSIIMDDVDITSSAYNNGSIAIEHVTGNVEITVTAVAT